MPDPSTSSDPAITVYWRPACGFCAGLLRSLERHGVALDRRNIWEDDDAAAFVRSVAGGSETVPTVEVGDRALVNPTADEVLAALSQVDPDAVPDGWTPREPGAITRGFDRLFGG